MDEMTKTTELTTRQRIVRIQCFDTGGDEMDEMILSLYYAADSHYGMDDKTTEQILVIAERNIQSLIDFYIESEDVSGVDWYGCVNRQLKEAKLPTFSIEAYDTTLQEWADDNAKTTERKERDELARLKLKYDV